MVTHDTDSVMSRIADLSQLHQSTFTERQLLRAILVGGDAGLRALLGSSVKTVDHRIPSVNFILSGLTRLGQKLGRAPDVKVRPPRRSGRQKDDSESARIARRFAEKKERIVVGLDTLDELDLQMPQQGRWLGAYGFVVWTLGERTKQGIPYVSAQPRDPFDCFPGFFGADQNPTEMAVRRIITREALTQIYPDKSGEIMKGTRNTGGGYVMAGRSGPNWENPTGAGVVVVEYYDESGVYVIMPEANLMLQHIENRLSAAPFVARRRPTIGPIAGQYDQAIGLQSALTRINMLTLMAIQDGVHTETNIYGDQPIGGKYKKGRNAVNVLPPGTKVEKPVNQMNNQIFQEAGRLEQQFRQLVGYPITDDAQSPHDGFITERGLNTLQNPISIEVREYQRVLTSAIQAVDQLRLEWEDKYYPNTEKSIEGMHGGQPFSETYMPSKDIAGEYATHRKFGVMSGWDESQVLIGGLQLLAAEAIDLETFRENLDGVDDSSLIDERNLRREISTGMRQSLIAAAQDPAGDPIEREKARLAMVELIDTPGKELEIYKKFFTPEEPELDPAAEEQILAGGLGGGGPLADLAGAGGGPPPVTTVLSRLAGSGVAGGSQRVDTL